MPVKRLIWILLAAILFAGLVRFFLLDSFRVASEAMGETLSSGDRVLVDKWTLGSRIPQAIGLPFSENRNLKLASTVHRLPGLSHLHRNDLIVYNRPQKNDSVPINLRPVLLSRCVGLPGDGIQLEGQYLFIDQVLQKQGLDALFCFYFNASFIPTFQRMDPDRTYYTCNDTCFTFLTKHHFTKLAKKDPAFNMSVRPYLSRYDTLKQYIPYKGMKIRLDSTSFNNWQALINAHEACTLTRSENGSFLLNGIQVKRYTFKQDYYMVLNDHQGYLNDSRTFGLVPASHIIGRSLLVLFSPAEKRFLEFVRQ